MLGVSRVAATGGDAALVLQEIARASRLVTPGASAAAIFLVAPTPSGLRLAASEGLSQHYRESLLAAPDVLEHGATHAALRARKAILVSDTQTDPHTRRVRDLVRGEGIRSLLALPLSAHDGVVGTIGVYRSQPGRWSDEEVDLLRFFAEHAASTVQTTQLMAEREEQLAGLTRLVRTLRAQGHEHINRLHALHGMLTLGEPDEALRFLGELLATHHFVRSELGATIAHPTLAGLLLAESAVAAQRQIELQIDQESSLSSVPSALSAFSLVTLVGNLLDNAFDAVEEMPPERRVVRLRASDVGEAMHVSVRDYGPGLASSLEAMSGPGVTTKAGHSGQGLALVRAVAEAAMGEVTAEQHADGTTVSVSIPFTPLSFTASDGAWGDFDV
jgi:sensor histidine kinase regulating citrate/malate metabolism